MSSTFACRKKAVICTRDDYSDENGTKEDDFCVGLIIRRTINQYYAKARGARLCV